MVSVSNLKKNWYGGLPTPKTMKKQAEKMEKDPDQPNRESINELGQYLAERGKLSSNMSTLKKSLRRGRQESNFSYMSRLNKDSKSAQTRDHLITLYEESLKGRWGVDPQDPELENKIFHSNQDYKKPLPYDF